MESSVSRSKPFQSRNFQPSQEESMAGPFRIENWKIENRKIKLKIGKWKIVDSDAKLVMFVIQGIRFSS